MGNCLGSSKRGHQGIPLGEQDEKDEGTVLDNAALQRDINTIYSWHGLGFHGLKFNELQCYEGSNSDDGYTHVKKKGAKNLTGWKIHVSFQEAPRYRDFVLGEDDHLFIKELCNIMLTHQVDQFKYQAAVGNHQVGKHIVIYNDSESLRDWEPLLRELSALFYEKELTPGPNPTSRDQRRDPKVHDKPEPRLGGEDSFFYCEDDEHHAEQLGATEVERRGIFQTVHDALLQVPLHDPLAQAGEPAGAVALVLN